MFLFHLSNSAFLTHQNVKRFCIEKYSSRRKTCSFEFSFCPHWEAKRDPKIKAVARGGGYIFSAEGRTHAHTLSFSNTKVLEGFLSCCCFGKENSLPKEYTEMRWLKYTAGLFTSWFDTLHSRIHNICTQIHTHTRKHWWWWWEVASFVVKLTL